MWHRAVEAVLAAVVVGKSVGLTHGGALRLLICLVIITGKERKIGRGYGG